MECVREVINSRILFLDFLFLSKRGEGVDKVTGGIGECGMQLGFRRFIYLGEKLLSCVISRIFFIHVSKNSDQLSS